MDAPSSPARSAAEVATPHARRYLTQLCKHFQHRRPGELGDDAGTISFDAGTCALRADAAALTMSCSAPDEAQLAQVQDVVARHLVRFAFREALDIDWHAER
jgi:uncharacterized protein